MINLLCFKSEEKLCYLIKFLFYNKYIIIEKREIIKVWKEFLVPRIPLIISIKLIFSKSISCISVISSLHWYLSCPFFHLSNCVLPIFCEINFIVNNLDLYLFALDPMIDLFNRCTWFLVFFSCRIITVYNLHDDPRRILSFD